MSSSFRWLPKTVMARRWINTHSENYGCRNVDRHPSSPSDLLRRQMANGLETLAKAVTLGNDATNLEQGGPQREQMTETVELWSEIASFRPIQNNSKNSLRPSGTCAGIDAQLQSLVANAEQALAADTDLVNSTKCVMQRLFCLSSSKRSCLLSPRNNQQLATRGRTNQQQRQPTKNRTNMPPTR